VISPGLRDIHSHLGLHAETEPARVNPPSATSGSVRLVSIAKAIVPGDEGFQEVLKTGVTSVLVAPETGGFVSGNAALIKLSGDSQDEMIVKEYAAVKFSMIGRSARMAQIWQARDFLKRAKDYAERWDQYDRDHEQYERRRAYEIAREPNKPHDANEPPYPGRDTTLELLRGLFKRNIPALVHARRADEISNTLKVFREEYGLDVIILGGEDGFRVIDELRQYGAGVAVGPEIMQYEKGKPINNVDLLADAGLRVAFGSGGTSGTKYLPMNATYAVRHGMDEDKAFRAMTIYPAELLRLDDRIGSIDVGKDADLVILSGDPLEFDSRVEMVIVNGEVIYEQQ
jgi:imidazolonepropionase-like amidohydrolase